MNKLKHCPICNALEIELVETFHKFDCVHNKLNKEEWQKKDNERNLKLYHTLIDMIKYDYDIKKMTYKQMGDYLIGSDIYRKTKMNSFDGTFLDKIIDLLYSLFDNGVIVPEIKR